MLNIFIRKAVLTDGSPVYDICLSPEDGNTITTLHCVDEAHVNALYRELLRTIGSIGLGSNY